MEPIKTRLKDAMQNQSYPQKPQLYPQLPAIAESALAVQEPLFDASELVDGVVIENENQIGGFEIVPVAVVGEVDVLAMWLKVKRNADTRRAYECAIAAFFEITLRCEPSAQNVMRFLSLSRGQMNEAVSGFQSALLDAGKSPATINQRVAAVRSLVTFAFNLDLCRVDGRLSVEPIRAQAYRDTRGIDQAKIKKLFKAPEKKHGAKARHKNPLAVLRDTALFMLLYDHALRRAEICKLDVGDFDFQDRALWIVGKGRMQRERLSLSGDVAGAIQAYLLAGGHAADKGPLFRNFHNNPKLRGERLTTNGLYTIVQNYGEQIGVKGLRPHKMRHASITHLIQAGAPLEQVKKLSRHVKYDTLLIYNDNAADVQGQMSNLLAGLRR
jgi:integrase/recombinase XerC